MNRLFTAFGLTACLAACAVSLSFLGDVHSDEKSAGGSKELLAELKNYQHKIVYETNRDGNWELYLCNADGSDPINLTRTPDVAELYPKPSPDGTKICVVADDGKHDSKLRNI